MSRLWVFGGSMCAFLPHKMGEGGSSNPGSWLINTKKGSVKLSARGMSPLISPVCLCSCRSQFPRCALGHGESSCLRPFHKRERANNGLAQELIVNSWSWHFPYYMPTPAHPAGSSWGVGGGDMGRMVLEAFVFESLVLSFGSGKWFPRKSHFCQDQTGEPTQP